MSSGADDFKRQAAEAALDQVTSDTVVGLGTGSTAAYVIQGLAARLRSGSLAGVRAVPTSVKTATLARDEGIELVELQPGGVDLAIDGCDEVDAGLRLIKGLGGALAREKLVALEARRFVVVADSSKWVSHVGELAPVPVEVLPFGVQATLARLEKLGGSSTLRVDRTGAPVLTDNGNHVVDVRPPSGFEPAQLAEEIKAITGVVEHGLFLGLAHEAILAGPEGLRVVRAQ